jgi:acyl-homoserine-lactone acylase
VAALAVVAVLGGGAAEAHGAYQKLRGERGYSVAIRRTAHGIPHIVARDYQSLGYGYGFAFAQDNICTIAQSYVTIRAQRSRFFGPSNRWTFHGNGSTVNNLNSDFFFQRIKDRRTVEGLLARRPPHGPSDDVKRAVRGYVAGYNRYLRGTGVDRLPDPGCRGAAWVTPITEIDVYRYFYKLALLASQGVAIDGIAGAQPPLSLLGAAAQPAGEERTRMVNELDRRLRLEGAGSNAYGLGREATSDGRGMVLGNPHFPWQGSQRFYQSHLTLPGKLDVAGASLFGVPAVLIGHTRRLAWSHTVSTARRFTPFELKLLPGAPTSYIEDGQVKRMRADNVTVQVPREGGGLENAHRTLYSTEHGPVFTSLLGLPLFPWTPLLAHALADANAANFRYLNHFFDTDRAQSVSELNRVLRRNQGIPWVNTIAADSTGEALYADIGVVPNVSNAKAARCGTVLGRVTLPLLGVAILDGSRSACRWDNDPDALQPGTFGPRNLPSLVRSDYVTNSNDSYWLSNPKRPLTGFARIIGDERTPRSLRTRLGLLMVDGRRFTLRQLMDTVFNNRQHAGELFRDPLVALCRQSPVRVGTRGLVNVSEACPVLERWDLKDDLDSRGAVLFRRFAQKLLALPGPLGAVPVTPPGVYSDAFDPGDGVRTPRRLNSGNPLVGAALADAVDELRDNGIPLDARLREYQSEPRGSERIPIHGGPGGVGVFNAISAAFRGREGFPDVNHGSSFVMAAHMRRGCPESRSILTYSLSANPRSPYFADQTRLFSRKQWVDMRFCQNEVVSDRALRVTEIGCVNLPGLRSATVSGTARRLRLRFRRALELPVRVEVFRGGRRVARFRRARSFTWRARGLADGSYVARFRIRGLIGRFETRRVRFAVAGGRVRAVRASSAGRCR